LSIRILDQFFRHKFLLAVPVLVFTALGVFWMLFSSNPYYASRATIWVEKPTEISGASVTDFSAYIPPAQNQATSMRELLGTRSFLIGVAKKTGSTGDVPDTRLVDIKDHTFIAPYGDHVLYVESRYNDPVKAAANSKAVIDTMTEMYAAQIKAQAERSSVFYEQQVNSTKETYDATSLQMQAFLRTHPQLLTIDRESLDRLGVIQDPELGRVYAAQQTALTNYNAAYARLADSKIAVTSSNATAAYFSVVDEPRVPANPVRLSKRSLLIKPATGFVMGLVGSTALFLLLWRSDRKVRFASDLAFAGADLVVVSLPVLRAKKRKWPTTFVRIGAAMQSGIGDVSMIGSSTETSI
jgi:uncharacterized protein involved in exopolysaccharide biosynthesis